MSAGDWWANLLQGSVGSFLSLLGLFAVFYLTRWHEKKRDRQQWLEEHRIRSDDEIRDSISTVVDNAYALRVYDHNDEKHARALAHSLMLLAVRAGKYHPNTALWAEQKSIDVLECLIPGTDPRAHIWEAAVITASLNRWLAQGQPDTLRPRKKNERQTKVGHSESMDVILPVAKKEMQRRNLPATFENMRMVLDDLFERNSGDSPLF